MPNRFALAPLTNLQSHKDGTLSDDEFAWLTYRAEGGFGLTMTCAAHVQAVGQGFAGLWSMGLEAEVQSWQEYLRAEPITWPSTSLGFSERPMSCATHTCSTWIQPVSGSRMITITPVPM